MTFNIKTEPICTANTLVSTYQVVQGQLKLKPTLTKYIS